MIARNAETRRDGGGLTRRDGDGLTRRRGDAEGVEAEGLTRRRGDAEGEENEIGGIVVDSAVRVHRDLGSGLLESVPSAVLSRELEERGLIVERQVPVLLLYRGLRFEEGFRADMVVSGKVILALKSVEQTTKAHAKQVFTYLKLTGLRLGYLLNFGANLMKDGIERIICNLPEPLSPSNSLTPSSRPPRQP